MSISISVRPLSSHDTRATCAPQVHKTNVGLVCGVLLGLVYMRDLTEVTFVSKIIYVSSIQYYKIVSFVCCIVCLPVKVKSLSITNIFL